MRKSFTLSEILIAIIVIGIIAALTIPNFIVSYKRQKYTARLKKFYSVMNNAIRESSVNNGISSTEWDHLSLTGKEFFLKYLSAYIKYDYYIIEAGDQCKVYLLDDTSIIILPKGLYRYNTGSACYKECIKTKAAAECQSECAEAACTAVYYDINGNKKPNKTEYDIFRFGICGGTFFNELHVNYFDALPDLDSETNDYVEDRAEIRKMCADEDNRGFMDCTKLLRIDGWEFKEDYPWKI